MNSNGPSSCQPIAPSAAPPASLPDGAARMALEAMHEQVCLVDAEGTIVYVNPAWEAFARDNGGDPALSGVGSNYLRLCGTAQGDDHDEAQGFHSALRDVLEGRAERREHEYPCHSPRELRWYVATVTRLPPGGPAQALVVHQPVTAQRLALAQRVQAQRLEMLAALSVGLAHDFNNLLASVLGNASALLADLPPEHPCHGAASRIEAAGRRGRELIRRNLALGRGDIQAPQCQPLRPLVEEAVTLLRLGPAETVTLNTAFTDDDLWVCVDATDLQQALMNLVLNAWHALKGRANPQVTVGLARQGQGKACLWVEDNGVGIPTALHTRIFEPFFTTRPVGEGTGLGLAQVAAAMARAGGSVTLNSQPGQGSRFNLLLPLAEADSLKPATDTRAPGTGTGTRTEPLAPVAPDTGPAAPSGQPPAKRQVLVVDDDEVVGMTLCFLLERAGFETHLLHDPGQALSWFDGTRGATIDLLITDQSMPTMTGLQLCKRLRQRQPQLPLLLVTGAVSPVIERSLDRLGRSAIVAKENTAEALLPAVRRLLQQA
jgi:signal transduction histidine kinase/CheY-like chemotaxis protein